MEAASPDALDGAELIVDALFGAGLSRSLDGAVLRLVQAMTAHPAPVIAVDLPSGVNGDTGQILGAAAQAQLTVTFFRQKPGHLLAPGRFLCGEVITADIGVPDIAASNVQTFRNTPALWPEAARGPAPSGHKYTRGHALIAGGAETTGAARLTARAALRSGAGLATIAAPRRSWPVYAAAELAVMVRPIDDVAGYDGAAGRQALFRPRTRPRPWPGRSRAAARRGRWCSWPQTGAGRRRTDTFRGHARRAVRNGPCGTRSRAHAAHGRVPAALSATSQAQGLIKPVLPPFCPALWLF